MFEGFEARHLAATGADIYLRIGGGGPPVLLLHGYPQTHVCWHHVAPALAEDFTVVVADCGAMATVRARMPVTISAVTLSGPWLRIWLGS